MSPPHVPIMCQLRLDIAPSTLHSTAGLMAIVADSQNQVGHTHMHQIVEEYISAYIPKFLDVMLDPESERLELRQEADVLAERVGLSVNSEGRYSVGLWDIVMSSRHTCRV